MTSSKKENQGEMKGDRERERDRCTHRVSEIERVGKE